jgi:hypothetical protein
MSLGTSMDIFISHSSEDEILAGLLIKLLRLALGTPPEKIRCTSVDGYRLEIGANSPERIKMEVRGSRIFVALLTPASLRSNYVLFELGARWGGSLPLCPLLAKGASAELLPGPIAALNALYAENESQLRQFLGDIAGQLELPTPNPAVYANELKAVCDHSFAAAVFEKSEGKRIKGRGNQKLEQYYVSNGKLHYLDLGAAAFCDSIGLQLAEVEPNAEEILCGSMGPPLNEASMRTILQNAATSHPAGIIANSRLDPNQERILSLLWRGSHSTEAIAGKLSLQMPEAEFHTQELENRSLVHIPIDMDDEQVASLTQEGRRYVLSYKLQDDPIVTS